MRVLHVYSGNLFGGIEQILVTLAEHRHVTPEMEPSFALCFDGQLNRRLRGLGVPVHDLGAVHVRYPHTIWRARRTLRHLLASGAYDVVVTHSVWLQGVFGAAIRASGTPLAFWIHDLANGRHWLDRWARRTRPDRVTANSAYTAATVATLYADMATDVVHPPVVAPEISAESVRRAVREELGTPPKAMVIVQTSRLEPIKGHRAHIEALGLLHKRRDWVCWMIGGPQRPHEVRYFEELKETATRLGIADRVRFLGLRVDVRRLLEGADVYCQPNIGPEAFGMALVEALFAGLPAVTTALGGVREVADETCTVTVPPGDSAALGRTLTTLLDDPGMRAKLSAAAPLRARLLCDAAGQMRRLSASMGEAVGVARARRI